MATASSCMASKEEKLCEICREGRCPGNKKMAKNDVNYIILMKNFTTKK